MNLPLRHAFRGPGLARARRRAGNVPEVDLDEGQAISGAAPEGWQIEDARELVGELRRMGLAVDDRRDAGLAGTLDEAELAGYRVLAEHARDAERVDWVAAGIVPGARVLDVGCGAGTTLVEMARLVEPGGTIVGLEPDSRARVVAARVIAAEGIRNASLVAGEAEANDLPARSFDVVMVRHVLLCCGRRARDVVSRLCELLRRGGCIYLVEADLAARRVVPRDEPLDDLHPRWLEWVRRQGGDLDIGAQLGELVVECGLDLVDHSARYESFAAIPNWRGAAWNARERLVEAGLATPCDLRRWDAAFRRPDPTKRTIFLPLFRAIGRRRG